VCTNLLVVGSPPGCVSPVVITNYGEISTRHLETKGYIHSAWKASIAAPVDNQLGISIIALFRAHALVKRRSVARVPCQGELCLDISASKTSKIAGRDLLNEIVFGLSSEEAGDYQH